MHIDPLETHYSTTEIADAWGIDRVTALSIFEDEPGVIRLGPTQNVKRRTRREIRIPESVLRCVYLERINR